MNKSNAKDYLPFVQALIDGKIVERQSIGFDKWQNLGDYDFTLPPEHYRIKPEPIERWLAVYSDGGIGTFPHETKHSAMQQFNAVGTIKLREVTE